MAIDPQMQTWLVGGVALGAGIAAGILIGRRTGGAARRMRRLETDLAQARADVARMREATTHHFAKGADLLTRVATDYRALFEHFVAGADQLCGGELKQLGAGTLDHALLGTTTPAPAAAAESSPPQPTEAPAAADKAPDVGRYERDEHARMAGATPE